MEGRKVMALVSSNSADAEVIEQDTNRMRERIREAVADNTGRLKLYLNNMMFADFDCEIERISSLQQLYCQSNPLLWTLPASIARLANLKILNASNCGLESLSNELCGLQHLESLNVSHNKLKRFIWDVPRTWVQRMQKLDISHNPIQYFSPSCVDLFSALRVKFQEAAKVQLYPEQSLKLSLTDMLFKPSLTASLSSQEEQRLLSGLLPDEVEHCSMCGALVVVGRPHVYVQFLKWSSAEAPASYAASSSAIVSGSEESSRPATGAQAGLLSVESVGLQSSVSDKAVAGSNVQQEPVTLLPVLHPLCKSVECHLKTHKNVLLHTTLRLA